MRGAGAPRLASLLLALPLLAACGPKREAPSFLEELDKQPRRASPLQFSEATDRAGLRFQHTNGAAGALNLPETMGSGCAFLDYDSDGWQDIFFVNSRPTPGGTASAGPRPVQALYHNNRDGTFTDVTSGSGLDQTFFGMGCAAADFDNDGREDLYVTSALDGCRLFRNLGGGRFEDVAAKAGVQNEGRFASSAAWLDYDRDGKLDLFVANYIRYQWGEDKRCLFPETHRTYCNPNSFPTERCRLYKNLGGGRFQDVSAAAGISSATGKALGILTFDFDSDGWPDIMVTCDTTPNLLFHNLKGRFREEGIALGLAFGENGSPRAGMGVDAAYTGNDDRLGVLVSNFANEGLSFFTQSAPRGAFIDTAGHTSLLAASRLTLGFGLLFSDFDGDMLRDVLVVNGHVDPWIGDYTTVPYAERPLLFHNQGGNSFDEVGMDSGDAMSAARVARGLSAADYDRDGRVDLLISSNGGRGELLHNDAPARHWLEVALEGVTSNRSAIGATVRVRSSGTEQRDWVKGGASYCSAPCKVLHLGLGEAAAVESLEVSWPSGRIDRYGGLPVDRLVKIREGSPRPQVMSAR